MDVNIKTSGGDTPLHEAKDVKTAKILLDNGAGINIQNNHGLTPLVVAVSTDRIELAKFLIEKRANSIFPEKIQVGQLFI